MSKIDILNKYIEDRIKYCNICINKEAITTKEILFQRDMYERKSELQTLQGLIKDNE